MRSFIPNLITLSNLFSGVLGCLFSLGALFDLGARPDIAAFCILVGAFLDFFDGASARWLKVSSEIGKQLDSLADLITFGLCPALILFSMQEASVSEGILGYLQVFLVLLLPLFTAYRLAKFNIDEEQSTLFKGLPSPAAALVVLSLPLIIMYQGDSSLLAKVSSSPYAAWFYSIISLTLGMLMVASFYLHSLKFKGLGWKGNEVRWILLASAAILVSILGFTAIPFIIFLYLIISIVHKPVSNEIQSGN